MLSMSRKMHIANSLLAICQKSSDASHGGVDRPLGVAEYENEIRKVVEMLPIPEEIKENLKAETDTDYNS